MTSEEDDEPEDRGPKLNSKARRQMVESMDKQTMKKSNSKKKTLKYFKRTNNGAELESEGHEVNFRKHLLCSCLKSDWKTKVKR